MKIESKMSADMEEGNMESSVIPEEVKNQIISRLEAALDLKAAKYIQEAFDFDLKFATDSQEDTTSDSSMEHPQTIITIMTEAAAHSPVCKDVKKIMSETQTDEKKIMPESQADGKKIMPETPAHGKKMVPETQADGKKMVPETQADGKKMVSETQAHGKKMLPETQAHGKKMVPETQADGKKIVSETQADGKKIVPETQADGKKMVPETQAHGKKMVPETQTHGKKIVSETQADGKKMVPETQADGKKMVPETQAHGKKMVPETQAHGKKIVSETQADGKKMVPETQADGKKMVPETQAHGKKMVPETQAHGKKIVSETQADGKKMVPETQAHGKKMVPETQAHGKKIVSETQADGKKIVSENAGSIQLPHPGIQIRSYLMLGIILFLKARSAQAAVPDYPVYHAVPLMLTFNLNICYTDWEDDEWHLEANEYEWTVAGPQQQQQPNNINQPIINVNPITALLQETIQMRPAIVLNNNSQHATPGDNESSNVNIHREADYVEAREDVSPHDYHQIPRSDNNNYNNTYDDRQRYILRQQRHEYSDRVSLTYVRRTNDDDNLPNIDDPCLLDDEIQSESGNVSFHRRSPNNRVSPTIADFSYQPDVTNPASSDSTERLSDRQEAHGDGASVAERQQENIQEAATTDSAYDSHSEVRVTVFQNVQSQRTILAAPSQTIQDIQPIIDHVVQSLLGHGNYDLYESSTDHSLINPQPLDTAAWAALVGDGRDFYIHDRNQEQQQLEEQ